MAKRTTKKYDLETGVLTIAFVNGSTDFDIDALPDDMKRRLMLHGASQLLGDSYAGENDEDAYKGHALKRYENLTKSDWSTRGTGSGLDTKLEEAEERLAKYIAMSDDQKRLMAGMGVTRSAIEKEITRLEKAITKRDEKN
jgi:hypothetical protein